MFFNSNRYSLADFKQMFKKNFTLFLFILLRFLLRVEIGIYNELISSRLSANDRFITE